MNVLIIETVSNGWIVRPFDSGDLSYRIACKTGGVHVYSTVEALQKDLPRLLASDQNPKTPRHEQLPTPKEHGAAGAAATD